MKAILERATTEIGKHLRQEISRMKVLVCENTPDGIFTAIYDGWAARLPIEQIRFRADGEYNYELFVEYEYIETDYEKAKKVATSVARKISRSAYEMMYCASLSYEEDKIDVIYRFLKKGFKVGAKIVDMYSDEDVCRIFELQRNVKNEAHASREFLRFHDSEYGILMAKLNPKNQVLPLMTDHFADRFPEEHFIIIDEVHGMASFHERGKNWYLAPITEEAIDRIWSTRENGEYIGLWKTFFHTIAIKERTNYNCQRNLCALRYRDYMVEFQ